MTTAQHPARPETKSIALTLKQAEGEGRVRAVISTFNQLDRDGDIMKPEAFAKSAGKSIPMVWSHDWDKPVGKGTISVSDAEAVFDGQFFMDTEHGSEAFKTVRNMGDLQEYSIGFRVLDSSWEQEGDQWTRSILDIELFEASPVLVGAARGTRTLDIKSHGGDDIVAILEGWDTKALSKRHLEQLHAATALVASLHTDNCNMGEDCPMYPQEDGGKAASEAVHKDAERARAELAVLDLEFAIA